MLSFGFPHHRDGQAEGHRPAARGQCQEAALGNPGLMPGLGAAVALRLPGKAAVWQVWGFPRNKSRHIVVFRAAVIRVQICSVKALQNLEH